MGRPGQKVLKDEDGLADRISLGLLARAFPRATVEAVVQAAKAREQRTRMLPSWLVVYYVLALALFMDMGGGRVMRKLAGTMSWAARGVTVVLPSEEALSRARARLGPVPLRLLFESVAGPLASPDTPGGFWRGRRVLSIDGTTLDVQDTEANWARFGGPEPPHPRPACHTRKSPHCQRILTDNARTLGDKALQQFREVGRRKELTQCLVQWKRLVSERSAYRGQEDPNIEPARMNRYDLLLKVKQCVNSGHSGAHRVFDGEHAVIRNLSELAEESEINAAWGDDLGTIACDSRHEVRRDIGHDTGDHVRGVLQDLRYLVLEAEVITQLLEQFTPAAVAHPLLDMVAHRVREQAICPEDLHVVWLVDEVRLLG